jgi:hypothetical protein
VVADDGAGQKAYNGQDVEQKGGFEEFIGVKGQDHPIPRLGTQGIQDIHFHFLGLAGFAAMPGGTGFTGTAANGSDLGDPLLFDLGDNAFFSCHGFYSCKSSF